MGKSWSGLAIACSLTLASGGVLAEAKEAGHGGRDGSKPGQAQLLKSFPAMNDPSIRGITELVEFRGATFFGRSPDAGGPSLWKSNGTAQGTVLVKQFPAVAGASIRELTVAGGRLFFVADDGEHGAEPWLSDGTSQGTRMLADLTPGPGSSSLEELVAVRNTLFFVRRYPGTPIHEELWKSDGSATGTVRVKDLGTVASGGIAIGLTASGDSLFFSGLDPEHGREPWKSDGTEAGTTLIKDINPGPPSSFPNFPVFIEEGVNYFAATDPVYGRELWRSDSTESGTVLVEDIAPGPDSSRPRPFSVFKGQLYFTSSESPDGALRLRKIQPGQAHSEHITDIPNAFGPGAPAPQEPLVINAAEADGQLFMTVYFPGLTSPTPRDAQLWCTNGTSRGTRLLHKPLFISDRYRPPNLLRMGDRVIFTGSSPEAGDELWVSNGTVKGTRVLQDLLPGSNSSAPLVLTRSAGELFFVAQGADRGEQLWKLPRHKHHQARRGTR
jgi:ELWxxDGT repeat protein